MIRIFAPQLVDPTSVSFQVDPGTAVCTVDFERLPKAPLGDTLAAVSIQALQLAADMEPGLECLSAKYDFYFPNGECCFDD